MTAPSSPELSLVVPCFNEGTAIAALRDALTRLRAEHLPTLEAVLVDDGSSDRTGKLLEEWSQADPWVTALLLERNHGVQTALLSGLSLAGGGSAAVLDADLQDPPELLPAMMRMLRKEEAWAVVGVKRMRHDGSRILSWAKTLATYPFPMAAGESDFCVLRREAVEAVLSAGAARSPFRVRRYWALRGRIVLTFPYERRAREAGLSKFNLSGMGRLWWRMAAGFYGQAPPPGARFSPPSGKIVRR